MLVFLLVFVLIVYYLWSQRKNFRAWLKIGGPFGYPFIGVGLQFADQKKILKLMGHYKKVYGNFYSGWLGPKFLVATSDPNLIKSVLNSDGCIDKSDLFVALEYLMKNGLLLAKGSNWYRRRKLLNPAFTQPIILEFFDIYNDVVGSFMQKIEERVNSESFDFPDLLSKGVLEIACQTTMGKRVNLLNDENWKFFKHFHCELDILTTKLASPWYHNESIYKLSKLYQKEKLYVNTIHTFTKKIIDEKLEQHKNSEQLSLIDKSENDGNEFVKQKRIFVEQIFHHGVSGALTCDDIDDEVATVLLTAADTLTASTGMAIYSLAMFQDFQDKLREEIYSVFPKNLDKLDITYNDLKDMEYLDMVLHETLRLFPPIPLLFRNVTKDISLDGIDIPCGTQMVINVFNMQRDEDIWGLQAKTFNPEHFSQENHKNINPYTFIPYSRGIRSCIGIKYSQYVVKILLINLLHKYKVSTNTKLEDLKYYVSISLRLENEFDIQFERL
ncbi:hypothetical protein ACFFRR_009095 [Megaselia abdita]